MTTKMAYTEAQKDSIYRWREKNKEAWKEKQRQNARKWYERNREAKLASLREKRQNKDRSFAAGSAITA